ncbi:glycosyltransferase [Agrococcus terreus]|uniref:glycosyltransferase n=1 Tax=Agrococcus terreus TaxID=574649 RepID=UPI00384B8AF9
MASLSRRILSDALPLRLAGNAAMAAATAARALGEDPTLFGIQLARRFPVARRALVRAAASARGADAALLGAWMRGELDTVRGMLDERAGTGLSRLAAEVAQAAGRPELVVDDRTAHPVARARAAWQLGEATAAIALLDGVRAPRLRRVLRAERALMTAGMRLRWTHSGAPAADRHGVLHLLTNSLPHTQSGYTIRSHAVLRAQRDAGLAPVAMTRVGYPVVVGGLGARATDVIDGIAYHRALPLALAATPDGRLRQQADALATLAARIGPAALQTTTHYPNAVVVREVAEALGLPWAYEVRGMLEQTWISGLASDEARERARSSERYRLVRAREAELAAAADAVFTLADRMRDDLVERGVPRERVELVPNGIDAARLDRERLDPADARPGVGLPREGFWVGAASSIVDYEGFDVLLRAVADARAAGHDIRALLIGDGAARPALLTLATELGLDGAAVLPGRVAREAAAQWLDALDVVVVPRVDRDVTRTVAPLKPIEAMASGAPLLVSDLPPLVESVGPGMVAAGATVPPGDAGALAERLALLAGDPAARDRLAAEGRRRAAERTWGSVGRTYQETYGLLGV